MNPDKTSRRGLLTRIATFTTAALLARSAGAAAIATPKAAKGPFYPTPSMRFDDVDNDLVKVEGEVTQAGGEILMLKGQVSDKNGNPQSGFRVEIWQCDVNGKYLHTGDSRQIAYDNGFQGFGHDITSEQGEYCFRTIKPARYPGRTPHIHVTVLKDEKELLTSQFYIDGEPQNKKDPLFRRLSAEEQAAVSMQFSKKNGQTETVVNIVV